MRTVWQLTSHEDLLGTKDQLHQNRWVAGLNGGRCGIEDPDTPSTRDQLPNVLSPQVGVQTQPDAVRELWNTVARMDAS
jgi:hypothetical protein